MQNHTTKRSFAGKLVKLFAVTAIMLGVTAGQQAVAAIKNTKHNLSSGQSTSGNNKTSSTAEICVFCHTPHASNTNVKAPLWNKPVNSSYTVYDTSVSSTIQGEVSMAGISLACLSCHDGTQAMDTVINRPGSGLYNATGVAMGAAGNWSGNNVTDGKLANNVAGSIANLSKDLTNDHPVGIQWCGGGIYADSSTGASTGTCNDSDFNAAKDDEIGGARVWWVDAGTGGAGTREKSDMQLYARTYGGNFQPFVECASCHDPHSSNTTFLRIENTGSAVCLACHNK